MRKFFKEFSQDPRGYIKTNPEIIYAPLLFVAVVSSWEFVVWYFRISPVILPPPSAVWFSLVQGLSAHPLSNEGYYLHALYTFGEALLGFALGSAAGIIIGTFISQFRVLERTLYPYILAFQSLPKVAVAPLIIVWIGLGMASKTVIAMMLTFFPLLVNSIAGFKSVDQNRLELMRSFSASRRDIFFKLKFPSALPFIFAGLDMASIYCIIGAILGEFLGADKGLGTLILQMNFDFDIQGEFSIFIILSLLGICFSSSLHFVERKVVFWAPKEHETVGY